MLRRASEPAVLTAQMKRQMDLSRAGHGGQGQSPLAASTAAPTWITSGSSGTAPTAARRARPASSACSPPRPMTSAAVRGAADPRARSPTPWPAPARSPGSHNEKRLKNILENYPRDELFQITEDELLHDRPGHPAPATTGPRIKTFTRKDPFDRFVSVLAFIPRERFDAGVRERIGADPGPAPGAAGSRPGIRSCRTRRWCASTTSSA